MKVVKWLFISVFGLAGLVVAALIAFFVVVDRSINGVGSDGGAGWELTRSLFHEGPRYFELTARLEVEGDPVEIKRVMECRPYFQHRATSYFRKHWYLVNEAMTHRLPDGSGVIVVVPSLCEAYAKPQPVNAPSWKAFPALPDDFVPLVLWTPDADNPEILEGYHSFESLARSTARVRFKSIVLRNDQSLKPSKSPDEFGVWANARYGDLFSGGRPKEGSGYLGLFRTSIGEDQWRKIPELRDVLEKRNESGFLDQRTKFRAITDLDQRSIRGSMRARRRSEHSGDFSKPIGRKYWVLDNLLGFKEDSGIYRPVDDPSGVIFYIQRKASENKRGLQPLDELRFSIGEEEFSGSSKFAAYEYYNVIAREIYQVDFSFVTFLPYKNNVVGEKNDS